MKAIIDESIGMIVFVIFAFICVFILGVFGSVFGGIGEEITNNGITAIVILVSLVLAIPPIGFIIWLINQVKQSGGI